MSLHACFYDATMPMRSASLEPISRTLLHLAPLGLAPQRQQHSLSGHGPLPHIPPPISITTSAAPPASKPPLKTLGATTEDVEVPPEQSLPATLTSAVVDENIIMEIAGAQRPIRKREAFKIGEHAGLDPLEARDWQLEKLTKFGDPLIFLKAKIDWEAFRPDLARLYEKERLSAAGRKPIDPVLMFKIIILQRLYNLSDDQTEYQITDRGSFQRFLGLEVRDGCPDAKTIWLFKERIKELSLERDLFFRFDAFLAEKYGFTAKGGQIIDATFVQVPRQRNTREENETIKAGGIPEDWKSQPHKFAQKDTDAEWTKKNEEAFYGYKDHTNVDQEHKFIRDYTVTGASVHDSRMMFDILETDTQMISSETGNLVGRALYADSAYRSKEFEETLRALSVPSCIHERAYKNMPLTEEQKASNREKSRVRVLVEHIYGCFETSMNRATFIRTIGSARACVTIGLMNLGYNMLRLMQLTKNTKRALATG